MSKAIRVWEFHAAPKKYQNMSKNGGDEDWVVVVPAAIMPSIDAYEWIPNWIMHTDSCLDPQEIRCKGEIVFIGSHS